MTFIFVYITLYIQGCIKEMSNLPNVAENGLALEFSSALKDNKEFVLVAVAQNGLALKYASAFKNDKEVVLVAVAQNGRALEFASNTLKGDPEVVMVAVARYSGALRHASNLLLTPDQIKTMATKFNQLDSMFKNMTLLMAHRIYPNFRSEGRRHFLQVALSNILEKYNSLLNLNINSLNFWKSRHNSKLSEWLKELTDLKPEASEALEHSKKKQKKLRL